MVRLDLFSLKLLTLLTYGNFKKLTTCIHTCIQPVLKAGLFAWIIKVFKPYLIFILVS